ncbi:amidohydrolase family protein [Aliihoeflea aestuarii]|jgi:dihydropyrimidinase|uniref:dihydroorotase n=1 Tax=Aliihoeflea aestuarii TaxID=453840 RepID=UPI002093C389|nr:dihydroorotase family protein [Aliihoeflea aestuarii]MCO6390096.1 amidohydrolase family protein [Aliihoeflea aestuarii]
MTNFDLLVRGGEAILPNRGRVRCDIAVSDGRIARILAPGEAAEAVRVIDATGRVILPGVIDAHLHLGHGKDISRPRQPEDATVESASAAVGGVTCMVPYLMASEPHETIFDEVKRVTEAGSRIDFGYHFIISTEEQLASVPDYIVKYGAPTLKIFMNNRGGEGKRLGLPDIDDGFLFRLAEHAAKHGGMVAPHPENIEVAWVLRDRAMKADPDGTGGLASWDASRPDFVEAEAVQRSSYLANVAGAPLYVVHTSSAAALETGLARRAAGDRVYFETCPHYLTHDIDNPIGAVAKINPPLRAKADRERLWRAVVEGEIDTVATDHVHRDISSKENGIWSASPGCPGMETLLPVMLTDGHHARGIPLERLVEVLCANPARLMGLDAVKGSIEEGKDADLVLVDLDREWTLRREDVVSSAGYSIYEGKTFKGAVTHTMVRGHLIVDDGRLTDESIGIGRYQHRKLNLAA